jgi:hypothetical protein
MSDMTTVIQELNVSAQDVAARITATATEPDSRS